MEAKFLARLFSFLSIFLAIYAQSLAVNDAEDSTEFEFETAIYYGDSNVNLGESFSITCIIPITDPIFWLKDGEPITRHNLRHGRDEHSFMLAESAIEGEKHKIEAHISVRHALKVHEGKYQCNNLHSSYHVLQVRSPTTDANDNQLSTETVYETIHELLTPSTAEAENIFTRTWEPVQPNLPQKYTPEEKSHRLQQEQQQQQQQQHRKQHHHHHHQQQQQQLLDQQQYAKKELEQQQQQHKFIYINATNFDGMPQRSASESSSESAGGLINVVEYMPATQYNELLTTDPWRSTTTAIGAQRTTGKNPPPQFPPQRTTLLTSSASAPPQTPAPPHFTFTYPGLSGDYYQSVTANSNAAAPDQQHKQQNFAKFPLQTMQPSYQQPPPMLTTYHHMQQPTSQTVQNMYAPQQNKQLQQHGHMLPYSPIAASTTTMSISLPSMHPYAPPSQVIMSKSKEPDFLVPNYDNAEQQLKVYEIRSALVLSCNITKEGDYDLTWEKNGTDVKKVKELDGRFRILSAERKFIIDKTDLFDDGLYSCVANNQKKHINVVARVVVRVPSNTGVVEGEKLTIVCTVVGTDPQLSWSIGNLTISNSTGRYILKPDEHHIENAILTVENISLDDRGEYKCIGRNAANEYAKYSEASDVSYVRVKGKLAALWPFLGIVSEVLILCSIILIYEKRRNKSELDESDTDPQEQKKKRRSYD